jgi:signal transduction histidine kinase
VQNNGVMQSTRPISDEQEPTSMVNAPPPFVGGSSQAFTSPAAVVPLDLQAVPSLRTYLARYWWRVLLVSLLLMAAFAAGLQMLFPKPSVFSWFFVVATLGTALEAGFLFAYFRVGRAEPSQSPMQNGFWAALGTVALLVSIQLGFLLGSGNLLLGTQVRKEMGAVIIIALASAAVVSVVYVMIGKLHTRQDELTLQKVRADVERERLAKRNTEAELKLMQAQVEPHFLYNTLANLRYLAESGSPQTLEMIDHLIEYLRLSLPNFRQEFATLRDEITLARAYLAIMEIRMGGKLRSSIDVPEVLLDLPLPPLMLLTLIENAVKHGIGRTPRGGGIVVSAKAEQGFIELHVADNGAGLAQTSRESALSRQPKQSGVGLVNIRERLAAIYGANAALMLKANEPSGVIATIRLPRETS